MEQQEDSRAITRAVQAGVLQGTRLPKPGSQPDMVLQLVRAAHAKGQTDMTRREIQRAWEAADDAKGRPPVRREAGLVSRCVKDLIDRQALQQLSAAKNRRCQVTGELVSVVALISA
jgi:hypothetical protein